MATTQYIGARYVPIIVGEWDKTRTYEPLMVVTYQGASYTSRQYVPAGIEITNESYWVLSANYNAQVEAYRQEVRDILPYDETPTEGSTKGVTSDGIKKAIDTAEQTNATAIANEVTRATAAEKTNADAIANEITRAKGAEQVNATAIAKNTSAITEINTKKVTIVIGDSWSDKNTISDAVWPEHFAELTGTTLDNYAKSAAGFTISGNTIATQIDSVLANYSTDSAKKNVKYVIVVAGVNDWVYGTHTIEALKNVMWPQIKRLSDTFKAYGTTVIWLPNMAWDNDREQYNFWAYNKVAATTFTGALVLNMFGWFTKDSYNNDMLHLKHDFNKYLGNCLYGIVNGGYVAKLTSILDLSKDSVSATMRMSVFDDHYTLMLFFKNKQTMSASNGNADIDCTALPFPPSGRICAMSNLSTPPLNPTSNFVATEFNTNKLIKFKYQCDNYTTLTANKFKGCAVFNFMYFDNIGN